jgi:hypothetical protein
MQVFDKMPHRDERESWEDYFRPGLEIGTDEISVSEKEFVQVS